MEVPKGFSSPLDYLERQRQALRQERNSFNAHYKDLSRWIQPRRGRFFMSDRNKGDRRNRHIINSTATRALNIAVAGLMSGLTSPARPWLKLEHPDPMMNERPRVQAWLADRERRMYRLFDRSGFYNAVAVLYEELLLFSTGALTQDPHPRNLSHFSPHTAGSYAIGTDWNGHTNVFMREFQSQVSTLVGQFGLEKVSPNVRRAYDQGDYFNWCDVAFLLEPNPRFDPTRQASKRFRSVYYEPGTTNKNQLLRESGYHQFPTYVPRWAITGEDIYGTNGPGMVALGDVKALQIEERRKAQGIDKQVSPTLQGPPSVRNINQAQLPGNYVAVSDDPSMKGIRPVMEVRPFLGEMKEDIKEVEQRINSAFYTDLWLAITQMEGVQPRNVMELSERKEEKLLMLGPVIERLYDDFLDPCIDRSFYLVDEMDPTAPPPPDELQGQELRVEYISILAQAQRAVATKPIDRITMFIGQLAAASADESVWDNYDKDEAVSIYGRLSGSPPGILTGPEVRDQKRQQRAAEQQQAMQAQQAQVAADVAQKGARAVRDGSQANVAG